MQTTEYFRKALLSFLNEDVTQSKIADALKIQRPLMNDFLKGRRNFSEDRKETIAEYFGKTYLDMLLIGHNLVEKGNRKKADKRSVLSLKATEKYPILKKIVDISNVLSAEDKAESYLYKTLIHNINSELLKMEE